MNKMRYIWRDVIHNFFSRRLFVFCVFQFMILHYYTDSIKQYAIAVQYPATPWVLLFMGQNVYFQFVYGISVVYFYSNVPFMPRYEMYVLMRQGRMWWVSAKLLRIWISAVMLVATTFILSILPLIPHLEWTLQWGKLYHSLALTDAGAIHHVKLFFPYELINKNSALTTVLILFTIMFIITGLTGTIMFALSIGVSRTTAMLAGTFLAVLSVVFANLCIWQEWIGFVSPFSWIDLLLLYGKVCRPSPSLTIICVGTMILGMLLYVFSLKAVRRKDLNWIEEK